MTVNVLNILEEQGEYYFLCNLLNSPIENFFGLLFCGSFTFNDDFLNLVLYDKEERNQFLHLNYEVINDRFELDSLPLYFLHNQSEIVMFLSHGDAGFYVFYSLENEIVYFQKWGGLQELPLGQFVSLYKSVMESHSNEIKKDEKKSILNYLNKTDYKL